MKKIVYSILGLAAIAVMVSCNKELESENNPRQDENLVKYSFGAQIATKTVLNGETPKFVEGDHLKICYITDSEETPVSTVTGTIEGDRIIFEAPAGIEEFYAVYPDSDTYSVKYDKTQGIFGVKLRQGYAKGTFADANGMVAYSTADNAFFEFKNLTAIVKIQAPSFDVKGVRFRGVNATNIDGSAAKFNGIVPIIVEDDAVSGFGNVTEEGTANMQTSSAVQAEDGYYYIPVNPVKINGLGIWFETDPERPGTLNDKEYTFERGHIYTINNIESKLYPTDWYVSPEGPDNFSGENAANAISYATMREHLGRMAEKMIYCYCYIGATFHLAAGEYTGETLSIPFKDYVNFTIEGAGADQTKIKHGTSLTGTETTVVNYRNLSFDGVTGVPALTVTKGKCNIEGCTFKGCTTTSGNGAALVMEVATQVTAKKCNFTSNTATNGAAVCLNGGTASSDDFVIFSAEDCILNSNSVSGSGGAILIAQGCKNGQFRFNNCRFDGNKATGPTSHGAVFYCNSTSTSTDATAAFFNGCTFINSQSAFKTPSENTTGFGYSIFGSTGSRVALNNCTLKAMNSKSSGDTYNYATNGSEVALTGSSVIANTCIWGSGVTGKRALASIGRKASGSIDAVHSTIVNSVIQHKSDQRNALFISSGWYLKMWGSIFAGLSNNKTAVDGKDYVFGNCFNRGLADSTLPGAKGTDNATKGDTGITHSYYTYTFNASTWTDFTPMTKAAVQDKVKNTPNIGELFDSWLTEIGAYDVDIMGRPRTANAMSPGSYNLTWAE